jgi:hypothetical protein
MSETGCRAGWKVLTAELRSPFAPVWVGYSPGEWVSHREGNGPLMVYTDARVMLRVHWEHFARRLSIRAWAVEFEPWCEPLEMFGGEPLVGWCGQGSDRVTIKGWMGGVGLAKRVRLVRELSRVDFAHLIDEAMAEADREAMDLRTLYSLYPCVRGA